MTQVSRDVRLGNYGVYVEKAETVNFNMNEEKTPKFIGDIPSESEVFLGRDRDLEEIHRKLNSGDNLLLLVNGTGGIGKTTLASHYYHKYQNEYAHLIWTIASPDINDAFNRIALSLRLNLDPQLDGTQRTTEIIKKLLELNKPCLLIIDNANELSDLNKSYSLLRKCSNMHLLLTTRITDFQKAAEHKIGALDKETALKLFNYYYEVDSSEQSLLESIFKAVDHNTLVIELLAKNLRELNDIRTVYTLENLKDELLSKGVLKLSRTTEVPTDYQEFCQAKPEVIVEAMYNLSELSEDEKKLLSIFSVLPAKDIPFNHLEDLITDFEDLPKVLTLLFRKGWVDKKEAISHDGDRTVQFRISPVIQEIIWKRLDNIMAENVDDLLKRLVYRLEYYPTTGYLENISYDEGLKYIAYSEVIHSVSSFYTMNLGLLTERIGNFHQHYGDFNKAFHFFECYASICQKVCENENQITYYLNQGVAYSKLAKLYSMKGDSDKQVTYSTRSFDLSAKLYDQHPLNQEVKNSLAIANEELGDVLRLKGDYETATSYYKAKLKLSEEVFKENNYNNESKHSLAFAYSKLGDLFGEKGERKTALNYFNESEKLREELCDDDSENIDFTFSLATVYIKKGHALYLLDIDVERDYEDSLVFFKKAEKLLSPQSGVVDKYRDMKNNLAIAYSHIAVIYQKREEHHVVLTYLQKQIAVFEELRELSPKDLSYWNNLAVAYTKIGDSYLELQNISMAMKSYAASEDLYESLYNKDHSNSYYINGLREVYIKLAHFYLKTDNSEMAKHYHAKYKHIDSLLK